MIDRRKLRRSLGSRATRKQRTKSRYGAKKATVKTRMKALVKKAMEETGQTMTEYAILVAGLAIASIASMHFLAWLLGLLFERAGAMMSG